MDQISREISRLGRTQRALFALEDSLAKILLTRIPEPDAEAMEAAVTRAKERLGDPAFEPAFSELQRRKAVSTQSRNVLFPAK